MEMVGMYKCPHCGKPGIPVWRKLFLGPLVPTTCKECGREVGVPYSSMLLVIPFIIAMALAMMYLDSVMWKVVILVILTLIMSGIYLKYIPLIPK
jgi:hypothetical protein